MKILLTLISLLLLSGCAAWGQFSDFAFGPDTKTTLGICDPDTGECTELTIKGDQTDMAQVINILAIRYGLTVTVEDE
jgi:hypothetical protein